MRIIKESVVDNCKVSIYHWNNRYLIKLEVDWMEQTYKINQLDLTDESELDKILNPKFMSDVMLCFQAMSKSFQESLKSL